MSDQNLTILSEKNVVGILVYLHDGPHKENDLTKVVSNYYSISVVLEKLRNAGLIHSWTDDTRYHARWHELTNVGKSVVKKLLDVQDILSGEILIDSDPDMNHEISSKKRDITSDKSINHSVPNSIPSPICPVKPTLIEILIAVHDNPGITKDDLTIKINKGNIKNAMQEAIDKQYLFKAVTGSSDIAPKYYITVGGIDHIGSRVFMKNGEDVVEMDCNAPSKPENTAR